MIFIPRQNIQKNINYRLNGSIQEVLVENRKNGILEGRTKNDKIVRISGIENSLGNMLQVKIETTGPWSLTGSIVNPLEVLI